VLRRILRRAARYARKLNMHDPFIYQLVPTVVEILGDAFPEIKEKYDWVMEVIQAEEESFNKTLDRGLEIFDKLVSDLKEKNLNQIPGDEAFRLYDTYGFPLDLTRILAEENDMTIEEKGFDTEMELQRDRARQSGKFSIQETKVGQWNIVTETDQASRFVGYQALNSKTRIHKYAMVEGDYHLVLNETPFYAESGGQVGDKGKIIGEGFELTVVDTQKNSDDIIHICKNGSGVEINDAGVEAVVDSSLRYPTMYNHTATHLLHAALRKILGKHVQQAGSLVAPDHMRFDFTHFKKISAEELNEVEQLVNQKIQEDISLDIEVTDFAKAKDMGAMALFGEKYGDRVRMITINDFSRELCGGTHVKSTGQIGLFIIMQESSVASGIRRIEAITGPKAIEFIQESRNVLQNLEQLLNMPPAEIPEQVKSLMEQNRNFRKELQKFRAGQILDQADTFLSRAKKFGNIVLVAEEFDEMSIDLLKQLGDKIRHKAKETVGLFINHTDNGTRMNFVCAITDDLIKGKGLNAGELVREAAQIAGGGGGGRPHLATAGGKDIQKLPEVLKYVRDKLAHIQ
jgi:alanyl-tRNA synthetase